MQKFSKFFLSLFLVAAFGCIVCAFFIEPKAKLVSSAGILLTLAGLVQLEISGFFSALIKNYIGGNGEDIGPIPSRLVREVIWNPDRPIRSDARADILFDPRTGFWLLLAGASAQLAGVWL